jgi:hypothetical protein
MISHTRHGLIKITRIIKREDGNSLSQVQGFMCLLKEDTRMSVHVMVLIWKLAHSLSIKIKHLKLVFKLRLIMYEAKWN